jgi:hypothetical protein
MKIKKPERLAGYILLTTGLVIILITVIIAIQILLGNMQMFQYVQKPTVTGTGSDVELAKVIAETVPLLNIIPTFLLFVVLIYAGSVLMGKGVGLIKEINWKIVKAPQKEAEETEPEETEQVKPAKKARTEKHNE